MGRQHLEGSHGGVGGAYGEDPYGPCVDRTAGTWVIICGRRYRLLQGARVDNVTRVPSWYMEEEVARGLNKDRRH